ncbi:MAG: hemin uptake protein HemP [Burkholderiales bacterium]|nr:hemin uptake protein HemP [Burkholderiales bacterium]
MAEFAATKPSLPGTAAPLYASATKERPMLRLKSRDLMQQMREVEIDHEGRIYRLRITQLNKLILTA